MKNLANVEQFYIQGIEIILDLSEEVFSPSKNGSFYADNIILKSNERIIDIGKVWCPTISDWRITGETVCNRPYRILQKIG